MVLYACERCGYETDKKSNFKNHINRKKKCKKATNLDHLKDKVYYTIKPNENTNELHLEKNETKINDKTCRFCLKEFYQNSNLKAHLKICKVKKEFEIKEIKEENKIIKEENKILKKEVKEIKKKENYLENQIEKLLELLETNNISNNITNNNDYDYSIKNNIIDNSITNNITNNNNNIQIVLNNIGEEDMSHMTVDYVRNLILNNDKLTDMLPSLVCDTNFNPNYPKNMNIMIRSYEKCAVYRNDQWNIERTAKVLQEAMIHNVKHMNEIKESNNLEFQTTLVTEEGGGKKENKEKKYQKDKNNLLHKTLTSNLKKYAWDVKTKSILKLQQIENGYEKTKDSLNEGPDDETEEGKIRRLKSYNTYKGWHLDAKKTGCKVSITKFGFHNLLDKIRTNVINKNIKRKYCKIFL